MQIAIIGSTSYKWKMLEYRQELEKEGHKVKLPAFDDYHELDDLGVCEFNRDMIEWAHEVHMFWDQRSVGTVFDFGMLFMAKKPFRIIYLEPKTLRGVMEKYEKKCHPDEEFNGFKQKTLPFC